AGDGVTKTVVAGTPVAITAAFTPGSGDTLTTTGIADNTGTTFVVGGSGASTPRVYNWTPSTPGSYVFYARANTTKIPALANYKSVTITVTAVPPVAPTCTLTPANQSV